MDPRTRIRAAIGLLLAIIVAFPLSNVSAAEPSHDLARLMEKAAPDEALPVLLFFEEQVDLSAFPPGRGCARELIPLLMAGCERSQARVRQFLGARGVENPKSFWINNSLVFYAGSSLIRELRQFPEITALRSAASRRVTIPSRSARVRRAPWEDLPSATIRRSVSLMKRTSKTPVDEV